MIVEKQLNICSNPKCQKKFENLMLVSNYSKKPQDRYYGCPFCFFRMDPTTVQKSKIEEVQTKETYEPTKTPHENIVQESCPQYFGYLSNHYQATIISKECLLCSRMSDCMLKPQNTHARS